MVAPPRVVALGCCRAEGTRRLPTGQPVGRCRRCANHARGRCAKSAATVQELHEVSTACDRPIHWPGGQEVDRFQTRAPARGCRSRHRAGRPARGCRGVPPGRGAAGRRQAGPEGAGLDHPRRAADLQPARRPRLGPRTLHAPHAGPARARGPPDPGTRALARRVLDGVARRPDLHPQAAARHHLLRRHALHVGRRRVLVPRALRREDREPRSATRC